MFDNTQTEMIEYLQWRGSHRRKKIANDYAARYVAVNGPGIMQTIATKTPEMTWQGVRMLCVVVSLVF